MVILYKKIFNTVTQIIDVQIDPFINEICSYAASFKKG